MARKFKQPVKDITSEIKFTELYDSEETIRLNPFKINGNTFKIIGTEKSVKNRWLHRVLCVETGKVSLTADNSIKDKVIMAKQKKAVPLIPVKKKDKLIPNPTIEEHRKKFPNQSNIFSIIPDIKKNP